MPTREITAYYVTPQILDTNKVLSEVNQRFTDRAQAMDWMRRTNSNMGPSKGIRWLICKAVEEVTPEIEDMTDEELRQGWREYMEVLDTPNEYLQHDEMGVADPFLNFPGDMEMYSDYAGEIAQEYTRRDEDRCIVHDSLGKPCPDLD